MTCKRASAKKTWPKGNWKLIRYPMDFCPAMGCPGDGHLGPITRLRVKEGCAKKCIRAQAPLGTRPCRPEKTRVVHKGVDDGLRGLSSLFTPQDDVHE